MITEFKNLKGFWYLAGFSNALGATPLARMVVGEPIVLFRDNNGRAHALFDRCCHRAYPLSLGKRTSKGIQCPYHGWEFSPAGACVRVPGTPSEAELSRFAVPTYPLIEQDGLIWVYPTPGAAPASRPFEVAHGNDPAYDTLRIDFGAMEAPFENVIDNFMDSFHPPFVHPGLIYSDSKRNPIEIEVRPYCGPGGHYGVEGLYLGEPPPTKGWIGRLFAERTTDVAVHEERYIMPSSTQAEYKVGRVTHLLSSHIFTPETPTRTRMYLVLRTKSRIPRLMTRPLLRLLFTTLFRQDIRTLQRQHAAMDRPLPRASSQLDYLSLTCLHFLQRLAAGERPEAVDVKSQKYSALI